MQVADEHVGDLGEAESCLHQAAQRPVSAVDQIWLASGDHHACCLLSSDSHTRPALRAKQQQRRLVGQRIGGSPASAGSRLLECAKRFVAHQAKNARSRQESAHRPKPVPAAKRPFRARCVPHHLPPQSVRAPTITSPAECNASGATDW
jgi:hypothetical protein